LKRRRVDPKKERKGGKKKSWSFVLPIPNYLLHDLAIIKKEGKEVFEERKNKEEKREEKGSARFCDSTTFVRRCPFCPGERRGGRKGEGCLKKKRREGRKEGKKKDPWSTSIYSLIPRFDIRHRDRKKRMRKGEGKRRKRREKGREGGTTSARAFTSVPSPRSRPKRERKESKKREKKKKKREEGHAEHLEARPIFADFN